MFNFEIYWDDSGTDKRSPIAVAAAYVATTTQWDCFVRDWDRAREQEGFDHFHMADFMAKPEYNKQPYCNWDSEKRNKVYFRLANIINTRVRMGFAVAVPKEPYDQYAPKHFRYEYADTHFGFAVKTCMGLVDDWHEKYAQGEPVRYVFDRMGKGKGELEDIWRMIGQEPDAAARGGLVPHGYSFEDKRLFKPLQAADMLAWNQFTYQRDVILKGLPLDTPRPYYAALYRNRPMARAFYRDWQIKKIFNDLGEYEAKTGRRGYAVPRWKPAFDKSK